MHRPWRVTSQPLSCVANVSTTSRDYQKVNSTVYCVIRIVCAHGLVLFLLSCVKDYIVSMLIYLWIKKHLLVNFYDHSKSANHRSSSYSHYLYTIMYCAIEFLTHLLDILFNVCYVSFVIHDQREYFKLCVFTGIQQCQRLPNVRAIKQLFWGTQ